MARSDFQPGAAGLNQRQGVVGYSAETTNAAQQQQSSFLPFASSKRWTSADTSRLSGREDEVGELNTNGRSFVTERSGKLGDARAANLMGRTIGKDSPDVALSATEAQIADSLRRRALYSGLFDSKNPLAPTTTVAGTSISGAEPSRRDSKEAASLDRRNLTRPDLEALEKNMLTMRAKGKGGKSEMDINKAANKQLEKVEDVFNKAIPTSLQHGYGKAPLDRVNLDREQIMAEAGVNKKQLAGADGKNPVEAQKNAQQAMQRMQQVVAQSQYNFKADTMEGAKLERNGAKKDENPAAKEAAGQMAGAAVSANTGNAIRGANPGLRAEMASAQNASFEAPKTKAPEIKVDAAPVKSMAA